jgi:cytoskeletal protein CcmA (bactofilin family)
MFHKQISLLHKKFPSPKAHSPASIAAKAHLISGMPSIVSADLTIRGNMLGKGDVQVEGKVFGRIEAGYLVVAEGGEVEGDIVAKAVAISGTVRGSIKAGTVTLAATARVQGAVLHDVLAIEAGAQLEGECRRLAGAQTDKIGPAALELEPEAELAAAE